MTQPLDAFTYRDGVLHAGAVPVSEIADAVGTPTFVYSAEAIRSNYQRIERAFAPLGAHLHYAVKASSNLHLLRLLHEQGAGMDVVSGGEMERAWLAGTPMQDIVFAGVGKTEAEQRAALDGRFSPLLDDAERLGAHDIDSRGPVGLFNVESESELEVLARVAAELGVVARACLRVNPDVDARTHEYTTTGLEENKFGVSWRRVPEIFEAFRDVASVELVGLHVHIGSPVREIEPYESAVKVLLRLVDTLEAEGFSIKVLDLGGGWPMNYTDGQSHGIEPFAEALIPLLEESGQERPADRPRTGAFDSRQRRGAVDPRPARQGWTSEDIRHLRRRDAHVDPPRFLPCLSFRLARAGRGPPRASGGRRADRSSRSGSE